MAPFTFIDNPLFQLYTAVISSAYTYDILCRFYDFVNAYHIIVDIKHSS